MIVQVVDKDCWKIHATLPPFGQVGFAPLAKGGKVEWLFQRDAQHSP